MLINESISRLYTVTGELDDQLGLQKVKGLKIINNQGSIEFIEPVDLVDQYIDQIVTIRQNYIEVYADGDPDYPQQGTKLNRKAILTIKNTLQLDEESIRQMAQQQQCRLVGMDDQYYRLQVDHFTRYGVISDTDDDDEDNQQIVHDSSTSYDHDRQYVKQNGVINKQLKQDQTMQLEQVNIKTDSYESQFNININQYNKNTEILQELSQLQKGCLKVNNFHFQQISSKNVEVLSSAYECDLRISRHRFRFGSLFIRDGFISSKVGKNNRFQLQVNRIVIHRQLFDDCNSDYQKYQKQLKSYRSIVYSIPIESIIKESIHSWDMNRNSHEMKQLTLDSNRIEEEQNDEEYKGICFPKENGYLKSLIDTYRQQIDNYQNYHNYAYQVEHDMDLQVITNILYGNSNLDLQKVFKSISNKKYNEKSASTKIFEQRSIDQKIKERLIKQQLKEFFKKQSYEFLLRNEDKYRKMELEQQIIINILSGNTEMASQLASANQMKMLGLIIGGIQTVGNMKAIDKQLDGWMGKLKMNNLYKILKGGFQGLNQITDITWIHIFGHCLYYQNNKSLLEILDIFKAQIDTDRLRIFSDQSIKCKKYQSIFYNLIEHRFIHNDDNQLWQELHPVCGNYDVLDYRQIWLLVQKLRLNEPVRQLILLRNFMYQLENVGLWYYCVYLLMVVQSVGQTVRQEYIQQLITKYFNYSNHSKKELGYIKKLITKLDYDLYKWVYLAKGNYYYQNKEYKKALNNYMKGRHACLANKVLIEELGIKVVIHFLSDANQHNLKQLNVLNQTLNDLSNWKTQIKYWKTEGGYLKKVVKILMYQNSMIQQQQQRVVSLTNYSFKADSPLQLLFKKVVNQLCSAYLPLAHKRDYQGLQYIDMIRLREKLTSE